MLNNDDQMCNWRVCDDHDDNDGSQLNLMQIQQ